MGDELTPTPMGELTETQTVVLRYVRGRVARREIQRNTAGRVRSILMGFAESYGRRPLKLVGRKHIELWLEDRQDLSPASRRNEFQAVRQFLNWCVEERLIRVNPMAAMKAPGSDGAKRLTQTSAQGRSPGRCCVVLVRQP